MKKFIILTYSTLVIGCAGGDYYATVNAAQNTNPTSPFFVALKSEYLTLSAIEWAKPDYLDGALYAKHAQQVSVDHQVLPDDLINRGLRIETRKVLSAEREKLLPLLDQTRTRLPSESARAQAMFDCWVEEAEENFQPEDILACRDQYFLAKATLETHLSDVLIEEENARLAAEEAARQPVPILAAEEPAYSTVETVKIPDVGRVMFAHNSAQLTAEAQTMLQGFVPQITEFVPTKLVVNGYTDTSGSEAYNLKLSTRRAAAVKTFLESQGIKADVFEIQGFGESNLPLATADGMKEPANRLVEIILMK